jgi:hypothetical protein
MITAMYDITKFPYSVRLLHAPNNSGWENVKKSLNTSSRIDIIATIWLADRGLGPRIDYDTCISVLTEKGITVAMMFTYAFKDQGTAMEFVLCLA